MKIRVSLKYFVTDSVEILYYVTIYYISIETIYLLVARDQLPNNIPVTYTGQQRICPRYIESPF